MPFFIACSWSGIAQAQSVVLSARRYLSLADTVLGNTAPGLRFDAGMVAPVIRFSFDPAGKGAPENQVSVVFREPERRFYVNTGRSILPSNYKPKPLNPLLGELIEIPLQLIGEHWYPELDWQQERRRFRQQGEIW
jgi:hypothetical protein